MYLHREGSFDAEMAGVTLSAENRVTIGLLTVLGKLGQTDAKLTSRLASWPDLERSRLAVIDELGFGDDQDEAD